MENASREQVESRRRCEKDRRALLAQVGALEAELEEQLSRQQATAVQASELCALRQQVESLDKHLRGQRQFMDVSVPRSPACATCPSADRPQGFSTVFRGGARRAFGRAGRALLVPTEQPEPCGHTPDAPPPRVILPCPPLAWVLACHLGATLLVTGRASRLVQLYFRSALPGPVTAQWTCVSCGSSGPRVGGGAGGQRQTQCCSSAPPVLHWSPSEGRGVTRG